MSDFGDRVAQRFREVQDRICAFLNSENGSDYREDRWSYDRGDGGGRTRIWGGGVLLEKGGVNFSALQGGALPASAAQALHIPAGAPYYATGVSLVLHPLNPHVPTVHLNVRYFETEGMSWFGGGVDLTPYYPEKKLVVDFHRRLERFCNDAGRDYRALKQACDEYFYLQHRREARGVGGLFFDHLQDDPETDLKFVEELGNLFPDLYRPFAALRGRHFSAAQRDFQLYRRSRYVEFNLIYDRGTLFGLQSGGRTESILMSLPPLCRWEYDFQPESGSPEARLTSYFLVPKDWVAAPPD